MIQRKQTLWLLLSLVCVLLGYKFPFFNGTITNGTAGVQAAALTAMDNIFLLILSGIVALLALTGIILFKDRKKQFRVVMLGLVASVGLIALYFYQAQQFAPGGHISLTALFTLGSVAGFFMAIRGIRHDEKLIKDLNRLR